MVTIDIYDTKICIVGDSAFGTGMIRFKKAGDLSILTYGGFKSKAIGDVFYSDNEKVRKIHSEVVEAVRNV